MTDRNNVLSGDDAKADRRAQAQRAQEEAAEERRRALAAQSSPSTEPAERIRIWERLHDVRLPVSANHTLVALVAKDTGLTVEQVRDEQKRRAGGVQSPAI